MSDALGELVALGRTASDRALLGRALGELDAQHRLASKIAAEPNLSAIMTEFVTRLMDAFGSLSAIRGQAVLDIACGSSSSRSPVTGRQTSEFEPWMCRLLLELGAHPVGLDIGDLADEAFEHYRVDLGVLGALDFLATGSFDAIHESRLVGSLEFRSAHGDATERIRREIHRQERRVLRPGGILIHSDGRPGLGETRASERPKRPRPDRAANPRQTARG
jgi:SAM-dependent methyltransferase